MSAKIVVHGGAGFWKEYIEEGLDGVREAASVGVSVLKEGGLAIDAVQASVEAMEDNPTFNAGRGSALTINGIVEMDAAIMDGRDLRAGAVALVRDVKNPIRLARLVMDQTDHVLLAGPSAERLADAFSLPRHSPITPRRRRMLKQLLAGHSKTSLDWLRKNPRLLQEHPELGSTDTVGALAIDKAKNLAAAVSTGGLMMRLPGRIGDTPQVGSGLYADNKVGAATVTGVGEVAVRLVLSKEVCSIMERGANATGAAVRAVRKASERLTGVAGVIALDRRGGIGAAHNTPLMPWAVATVKKPQPKAFPHGRIVAPIRHL